MIKKLADEDCRVVDLLLDRGNVSADPRGGLIVAAGHVAPERAQSLEKVLSLLHAIPVSDPPADLARRTLSRVDAALASLSQPAQAENLDRPTA